MVEFFNGLKHPMVKNITIFTDSKSEYLSEYIFDNVYKILTSKGVILNTFDVNHSNSNQPLKELYENSNFLFNLHFTLDLNGMLLCDSKILYKSDVVVTIVNEKFSIIKHRTAEIVDEYQNYDISRLLLTLKILNIRKNIYN